MIVFLVIYILSVLIAFCTFAYSMYQQHKAGYTFTFIGWFVSLIICPFFPILNLVLVGMQIAG